MQTIDMADALADIRAGVTRDIDATDAELRGEYILLRARDGGISEKQTVGRVVKVLTSYFAEHIEDYTTNKTYGNT